MKKQNFIEGAFVATFGIIACRVIGLLYVIPFYSMIGVTGGTLYGYAYSIYGIFLNLSIVGIPTAMSKITSQYIALGYTYTKERSFKIGKKIITTMGIFFFFLLLIFAKPIATLIIGDLSGGNTIEDVTFVIRLVSTALLVVPSYAVTKGYLQGHKMMVVPSLSNIIEQLVRVAVILLGTFLTLRVFNFGTKEAVGISVFAATIGAVVSYAFILKKIKRDEELFSVDTEIKEAEKNITAKDIAKIIIKYAIPFIVIDLVNSAYAMVDVFTIVRTLTDLGYDALVAETTYGVVCTWATKLTMIVISIATGIGISLIPNITELYVKKNKSELARKVNLALCAIILIALPMVCGLCFLHQSVWIVFYGYDYLSIDIFALYVWQGLTFSILSILINVLQSVNDTKLTLVTLSISFLGKLILSIPMMYLLNNFEIAYFGPILSTLIPQILAITCAIIIINKKYQISFKNSIENIIKTILSTLIMLVVLKIVNVFIPMTEITRGMSLVYIVLYASIGGVTYLLCAYKSKLLENVLGKNFLNKIFKRKLKKS